VEDTARLEPRLLSRDVTNRFVALLAAYTPCGPLSTCPCLQISMSVSSLDCIMCGAFRTLGQALWLLGM